MVLLSFLWNLAITGHAHTLIPTHIYVFVRLRVCVCVDKLEEFFCHICACAQLRECVCIFVWCVRENAHAYVCVSTVFYIQPFLNIHRACFINCIDDPEMRIRKLISWSIYQVIITFHSFLVSLNKDFEKKLVKISENVTNSYKFLLANQFQKLPVVKL